jgi:hypothetical protein
LGASNGLESSILWDMQKVISRKISKKKPGIPTKRVPKLENPVNPAEK